MNSITKIVPLPATTQLMLAQRKVKHQPSLIDRVEAIHTALYEDLGYRALIDSVDRAHAVEGSVLLDRGYAAHKIREYAKAKELDSVKDQPLQAIVTALTHVLRRFQISPAQRKQILGEYVPGETVGE